jgi:hypothetical protein
MGVADCPAEVCATIRAAAVSQETAALKERETVLTKVLDWAFPKWSGLSIWGAAPDLLRCELKHTKRAKRGSKQSMSKR